MNSQLEHDLDEYDYRPAKKFRDDNTTDCLPQFDERIDLEDSIENFPPDLPKCEICGREFVSKKELRAHIIVHLGEPRIVLKRCAGIKGPKKKEKETYWLAPETKGSLKLTLKKQQLHTNDAIKLTLKKSSQSEDFKVVNSNLDLDRNENNCFEEEVADSRDNEQMDEKEQEERSEQQSFENVIVNEEEAYENDENDNYENDDVENPLEDNEVPSLETNEGDSGVGSDMANPSEKEDQIVDDLHTVSENTYDNNRDNNTVTGESEDPEDADALEATCRETIENLKKLGEQSSSRTLSGIDMSPRGEDDSADQPVNMTQHLDDESSLSLLSKSSAYPIRSPNEDRQSPSINDKERGSPVGNSNFNWNQLSEDLTNKSNGDEETNKDNEMPVNGGTENNIDNAGSLLQNFLMEHHRRDQNEGSLGNNLPLVETEYVSLERLAETVGTCRVCNEKFRDITQLDEHRLKAGHFQCNFPECTGLVLATPIELAMHKSQIHGAPLSPHINRNSPQVNEGSPHHFNRNSPHSMTTAVSNHSPHGVPMGSPTTSMPQHINRNSPMTSPHHTHSPTYNPVNPTQQSIITPVNFEQLPAPVQQLAQQVQRMPLPNLPPGASTMIPGPNYYPQPPGRPPMYRVPGAPQPMHYPPAHLAHLYSQYGPAPGPYPQLAGPPPPMHPQMAQQMPRGRYPQHVQNPRAPRIPQVAPPPRQRMKRPLHPPPLQMQQQQQQQQQQRLDDPASKQRRMDLMLPERSEDTDCHVISQQKRADGLPVIQNVRGSAVQQPNRNDSTIHLTDSITLSVRQPGSNPAQVQSSVGPSTKKPDAKAVANVLAARGITVTPAANKNKASDPQKQSAQQQQQQQQQQQRQPAASQPANVTALNLNSAISIIPASSQRKQQEQQPAQFAVPQNKQSKQASTSDVERPPRPPTVDLTQDVPLAAPVLRRGRPPRSMLTCQVCDKSFQNQEMLTQHMASHRTNSKLLHKCNLCPAQYPTGQALTMHKQTYHKEVDTIAPNGGIELAIPVVDLKSPQVLNRLTSLGIQSYIPLSQLSAQTGGYFGLPIITIDGARNPNTCNLGALGATSILSLGPLKHLSNR